MKTIGLANQAVGTPQHDQMILEWNNPQKLMDLFLDYFRNDLRICWMEYENGHPVERWQGLPPGFFTTHLKQWRLDWGRANAIFAWVRRFST